MEKSFESEPQIPKSWDDLLGPFVRARELDENIRATTDLIMLRSMSGTYVCPTFQFDEDETGHKRVNPYVGLAWSLLGDLQINQLGKNAWKIAGSLAQTRPEYDGKSWADVLKDTSLSDAEKMPIYAEIVDDAVHVSAWLNIPLIAPSETLQVSHFNLSTLEKLKSMPTSEFQDKAPSYNIPL